MSRKRVVISGYYGFGNAGDEAVLEGIIAALREVGIDADITVLSSAPERTVAEHTGVSAVHRYNPLAVIKEIHKAELFISGGGSLFQDVTSSRSLQYYYWILRTAQLLHRKTMIWAQGVGPLNRPDGRNMVKSAFGHADAVTVRDYDSKALLDNIGIGKAVSVCADPAFLIEPDYKSADEILAENGLTNKRLVGISLRPWPGAEDRLRSVSLGISDACSELGIVPVFLPMQEAEDTKTAHAGTVLKCDNIRVLKALTGRCELIVGMRLHSLIFAASEGVPFIPLIYDPKVASFASVCGVRVSLNIETATQSEVMDVVMQAWKSKDREKQTLDFKASEWIKTALEPARIAKSLIY